MTGFECAGLKVSCRLPDVPVRVAVYVLLGGETFEALAGGLTDRGAAVFGVSGMHWNDLSPWPAPPVFRDEGFTGRADAVLASLEQVVAACDSRLAGSGIEPPRERILGGYSLAGLFAVWSGFHTRSFTRVMSASGSLWFDGFTDWMAARMADFTPSAVYLSLGDREYRARNPRMARVEDATRACEELLRKRGVPVTLQMNPGGHFQDPEGRMLKGLQYLMDSLS